MKKELIPFAVMALAMASCSSDDVVDVNPDPSGDALSFSIAVGHSRATETTITNLGDFRIVAKGVHPHGGVYDSFLIGDDKGGKLATHKENSIWGFADNEPIYWPTAMDNVLFWAYTCSQKNGSASASDVLPTGQFSFEGADAQITGFSPVKANLKTDAADGVWADGLGQYDLLAAFKHAKRSDGTSVDINFEHTLSQIYITATSKDKLDSDHRIVRIKGAWIVNTHDIADFSSGYTWADNQATHNPTWTSEFSEGKTFTAYGSFYKTPKELKSKNDTEDLLVNEGSHEGSLMLIPQTITKWEGKAAPQNPAKHAYILLLCRVELEHVGATHSDGSGFNPVNDDDIAVRGDNHYHQLFPVSPEKKFDEGEYGFVCVPVGTTFEMGKKYKFNLEICGEDSGAGIYPPDNDFSSLIPDNKFFTTNWNTADTELKIIGRPTEDDSKKEVGDFVLDDPIKFTVTVSAWDENKTWTQGQGGVKL